MIRKPCGRVLGHGETCSLGHLCDSCRELNDLDNRIEILEQAIREMHAMVHGHVFRSGSPKGFPEGSRTIGPMVLGGINNIVRKTLGRHDEALRYFRFEDDKDSTHDNR